MNRFFLFLIFFSTVRSHAQKVDSIYFNLYTDSLKKGTHNYINVVGKLSNGTYRPLNSKQVLFYSDAGIWAGNDLILDTGYTGKSVFVKATLTANARLADSIIIYLKTMPDTARLKTAEEIFEKKKN